LFFIAGSPSAALFAVHLDKLQYFITKKNSRQFYIVSDNPIVVSSLFEDNYFHLVTKARWETAKCPPSDEGSPEKGHFHTM